MTHTTVNKHKMNYIFSEPDQIDIRIKSSYLRGRNITRLVDKIKLNSTDKLIYDKLSGNWLINNNIIDLTKKSYFPFFIRRWFHESKMLIKTRRRRFDEKIAIIRDAYLQEASKNPACSVVNSIPTNPKVILKKSPIIEDNEIQKPNECLSNSQDDETDLINNYIEQLEGLRDSINFFGTRIYTSDKEEEIIEYLEKNIPSSVGKLATTNSIQEVIDELKNQTELHQEDVANDVEDKQEINEEEDPVDLEELTFTKHLSHLGYEKFYLTLKNEEKKAYKTICQPVSGSPLFALAAESFILGMRSIKGVMTQDTKNPYRFIIASKAKKGKLILNTPILTYDQFTLDMPSRMIIEYLPTKQQWRLIDGPKIIISHFIGSTKIEMKDINMSAVGGKIKLHYKLPFIFSSFQDQVDKGIINSREELFCYFKNNKMVVWD